MGGEAKRQVGGRRNKTSEIKPTKVVRRNKNRQKITGGLFVDFFGSSVLVRRDVRAWSAWGGRGTRLEVFFGSMRLSVRREVGRVRDSIAGFFLVFHC